jgi:anti-anti-sigma factor
MSDDASTSEASPGLSDVRWDGLRHDEGFSLTLEQRSAGYIALVVSGKLLTPVPDSFTRRALSALRHAGSPHVVVDLSRCDYLASSALGFLVDFFHACGQANMPVVVMQPNDRVRAIIGLLGLNQFLPLADNEANALALFATKAK